MNTLSFVVVVVTVVGMALFGAITLVGAWIDGRRQKLRDRGLKPTTMPDGRVVSQDAPYSMRPAKH